MSSRPPQPEIVEVDREEIALEPWSWEFALARRDEIERHFAEVQRGRSVWNGRVLLLNRYAVRDGVLRGACFETDYASFMAWRDWGFPDRDVHNVFAAAALRAADGAYLLGEMASDTASPGLLLFPCGTPEPGDVDAAGALALRDNLSRELLEETGIAMDELTAEPGWSFVRDGGFVAMIKRLTARHSAHELRSRIMRHIASEKRPELVDIRIVRGSGDLDPQMPRFVTAFLEKVWRS